MSEMTLGIDVSTWQDAESTPQHVDFTKAAAMGDRFVFVKSSQALFVDTDWVWNWKPAKEAGLLRGAYHFLTWNVPGVKQAEFMWNVIQNDPGELPMVADYEYQLGTSSTSMALGVLYSFLERIHTLSGRLPIIYTSWGFWRSYGSKSLEYALYPLWLAQYTTSMYPTVPAPWKEYRFWQYTDKGDGKAHGMESAGLDMNRFAGTYADLLTFAGMKKAEPTYEQKVDKLWAAHPELRQ